MAARRRAARRTSAVLGAVAAMTIATAACGEDPLTDKPAVGVGSHAELGAVELHNVYLAAPEGGRYELGQNTIGFLTITTTSERGDRLIGVTASAAEQVELRWDRDCDGTAEKVSSLPLAPEGGVPKAKGADRSGHGPYYLRFIGLTERLRAGTTTPLRFEFERAGAVTLQATVHGRHPSDARSEFACGIEPSAPAATN